MRCDIRRIARPMGWATSTSWTAALRHRSPPQWHRRRIGREPKLRGVRTDSVHDVGGGQVTIVLCHDTGVGVAEALCDQKQRRAGPLVARELSTMLGVSVHILPGKNRSSRGHGFSAILAR